MKSKLLKGLALLSFITLISVFLLYSAGYFARNSQTQETSPPPPVVTLTTEEDSNTSLNSVNLVSDTLPEERLPSTKAVIILPNRFSSLRKQASRRDSTFNKKEVRMMSSSKSGPILDASQIDSLRKKVDSLRKKMDSVMMRKKMDSVMIKRKMQQ